MKVDAVEQLSNDLTKVEVKNETLSKNSSELKKLFLKESTFLEHYNAQKEHYANYVAVLVVLLSQRVEISIGTKARILAACWAAKNIELADYLINGLPQISDVSEASFVFGLPEILKALNLLDTNRRTRQFEKKLKKLEGNTKVKQITLSSLKAKLNELKREPVPYGSVSGSLSKTVVAWVSSLSVTTLEFYALNLPKEPWRELSNMVHLSPKDFKLDWFLDYVYDKEAPAGSIVQETTKIFYKEEKEVLQVLNKWKVAYSFVRRQLKGTLANDENEVAKAPVRKPFRRPSRPSRGKTPTPTSTSTRGGASRGRGASRGSSRGRGASRGGSRGGFRGRGGSRGGKLNFDASKNNNNAKKEEDKSAEKEKEKEVEKPKFTELTLSMKEAIANYSSVDLIIWWHEELQCSDVDRILTDRLKAGESPTFGYGKLMERMLYAKSRGYPFLEFLIPIAEKRLTEISLPLERPVVVCGDASGSMQVAVKTATIISSLLTVLTSAELRFFRTFNEMPPIQPRTIREVLRVAEEVRASGGTTPAACLWESYKKKEVVKFFVMVTDEEENGSIEGKQFHDLFKIYREEVCPESKLVFISFLSNPKSKGEMMTKLEKLEIKPMQFKLNSSKPDLTKMDTFLALLSSESKEFNEQTEELSAKLNSGGTFRELLKEVHKVDILPTYKKKEVEKDGANGKEEVPAEKPKESCIIS